ncbi:hypothetical protein NL676_002026 [Syzygium grande]|nr:hypothetical protein NL676_002026 [Syzygium grande]
MGTQKLLLCFLLFSLLGGHKAVHGSSHHHHHHHHHHRRGGHAPHVHEEPAYAFKGAKLFVFGDSYADTGNNQKSVASSWKVPYGITFPGKPAGRFSDGRVFTDFLARFFGVKSPIPYQWWTKANSTRLKYGMNFAYGGTGVFDTLSSDPNMTVQIDYFQRLIGDSVYTAADVHSSVALLTNSGNDYSAYTARNGSFQDMPAFITKVVSQLAVNLKRVYALGVRKIAVAALQPLGCLPQYSYATSFQKCNDTVNTLVGFHNQLLKQAVDKLNNETSPSTFVIVDLYSAFTSVFEITENSTFENPLTACCMGVSSEYSCGSVDTNGTKMYTVCEDPTAFFFWDMVHPTQAGWKAVYSTLGPNLDQL